MNALAAIVAAAAVGSIGVSLLRWLRVAQREHYIAGSCWTTGFRWVRHRPPNAVIGLGVAVALVAAIAFRIVDLEGPMLAAALVTAVLCALFPWPMPIRGTPPLRFTRRAVTLGGLSVVLLATQVVVVGALWSWVIGLIVACRLAPIAVDVGAAIAAPLERRALERHRRRAEARLRDVAPLVVAVTGSWGKTSTKNHIRDLLSGSLDVVASPASWNNTAGLSRTVNEHLTDTADVLVAEMGTYGPGEIREMCAWVRPRVGVICAIGPMHLERMGTIDTVVAAKSEILEGVDTAILWVDDPHLAALADRLSESGGPERRRIIRAGTRESAPDLDVEIEHRLDELRVWAEGEMIGSLPAAGSPHPGNLACAVAAALACGVSAADIGPRMNSLSSPSHRATVGTSEAGVMVIDDTFNSNPVGARAALTRLTELSTAHRAVVTPGMVELGPIQDDENEAFARAVVESGATLIAVGWTNRRALERGGGADTIVVADRDHARRWVREHLTAGDAVLWENDLPDHYP